MSLIQGNISYILVYALNNSMKCNNKLLPFTIYMLLYCAEVKIVYNAIDVLIWQHC